MNTEQLKDKCVVITGASSGFGRGAALRFARRGAAVVLAARREDVLSDVEKTCREAGGKALAVPTDVGIREDVERLAKCAIEAFGGIDVWVNNAGAGAIGRFEDVPIEDHIKVIQTDLIGTVYGSYYAMRHFRTKGSGTLINIASVIGKVPSPYFASYAAAKHGVVGFSAALRLELKEDNVDSVRVCTVMPTTFDTPFFMHAAQYTGHEASPIPPTYDPEEVVETIERLAVEPEDEVSVGTAAKVANFAHQLFPGAVEAIMARQTKKSEFDKAAESDRDPGSLHEPRPGGTTVRGGWSK